MKNLKSLTFSSFKPQSHDPIALRRAKLILGLERQKSLANDPAFLVVSQRWVVNDNGVKERIEQQRRVRKWWRVDATGAVALFVRYGAKAIEFEKGKPAIVMPSKDQLIPTLDLLISAVRAGELDEHLAQQAKARSIPPRARQVRAPT